MKKYRANFSRPKFLLGMFLLMFIASTVFGQSFTTSGIITDKATKEPLPGVAVAVKGTTKGTVSNADGKYTISASEKDILVFSFIGFISREVPAKSGTLDIAIESQSVELSDIVVVGTRVRKSDLTGSIGSISSQQLKEVPTTDVTTAMQGKVAGLSVSRSSGAPGEDISIKVRGTNSISYGTNPVYVIDGIIAEEGLRMINPDDIASIEVLKDASSTALYGSKASNGVIVITTKRGQKGESKINYSGFATVSSFDNRLKTVGSRDMMNLRLDAYANSYMDANPTASRQQYIDDILGGKITGIFSAEELKNGLANNTSDWLGELSRTGIEQNHSLNFSGADDKSSHFVGFTYSKNDGILQNSEYERFGGRVNYEKSIKSWLKVGTNTNISRATKRRLEGDAFAIAMMANPMQSIDRDRLYMNFQGANDMGAYNPLLSLDISGLETHNRVLTTNFIEVNPLKDLNFRTSFSADIYNKQDNRYIPSYVGQSVRDNYLGEGWQWRGITEYWQWDNSVSYEKTFGKHRLFGLLSTMISKTSGNSIDMNGFGFPTDVLGPKNMSMASSRDLNRINSDYRANSLASVVARINYSYNNKYLLTATIRRDGSSKFAQGNQWGTFPSFSAAWNVTQEDFMKDLTWINQFKLRAGYGVLGNQNIPDYAYMTIYNADYSNGTVSFSPDDNRYGNPNIRWEKQKQWNLGFDATFLNNRLSITGEVFQMNNSDLLMRMNLWPSFGYNYQVANVAALQNRGVELSINAQVVSTDDFKWNLSGNISRDRNKVTKLINGANVLWNGNNPTSREGNLFVGQPLGTYYSFVFDKIAQQSDMDRISKMSFYDNNIVRPGDILPVDLNGDGKITVEEDMAIVGNSNAKFYGGFVSNWVYKNFTLDAAFTYSYGAKRYDWRYERLMDGTGRFGPVHEDQLNRWTPENTNTNIPRAYTAGSNNRFGFGSTDLALLNASFLRLAALTLKYNFPSKSISPFFSNLSVFTSGNNLFVITPYKGFDPETGSGYPLSRSFTFGVNVSF